MVEVGVMAYPVVIATMYGVAKVGRDERWGSFEWLRFGALALLFGLVVAVQVTFVMTGLVTSVLAIGAAIVSVSGAAFLLGMYLWDHWLHAAPQGVPLAAAE